MEQHSHEIRLLQPRRLLPLRHFLRAGPIHVLDEQIAGHRPAAARQRQQLLRQQWDELTVRAAFDGHLVELAEPLQAGQWLPAGEWLGTLVGGRGALVEAYVEEHDLQRLVPGSTGRFYPETFARATLGVRLEHQAQTAVKHLSAAPELASPYQGAIAASLDHTRQPQPEQALYRATLQVTDGAQPPAMALRGTVVLEGRRQSLIVRGWRNLMAVLIRESAF